MKINQTTTKYWNDVYKKGGYQDKIKGDFQFWYKFIDNVVEGRELNIIELGCGVGQYTKYLYDKGHFILGVDYSEEAIKICKERYGKNLFHCEDILKLATTKHDIVMMFEVLEHFKDPLPLLLKIKKLLTSEGKFIFSLPHKKGRFGDIEEHYTLWDYEKIVDVFSMFWNKITFYEPHKLTKGLNIFGVCENVK